MTETKKIHKHAGTRAGTRGVCILYPFSKSEKREISKEYLAIKEAGRILDLAKFPHN